MSTEITTGIAAMRFKEFDFPYNPETLKITSHKEEKSLHKPGDRAVLQVFGNKPVIVSGEGELFGNAPFDDHLIKYNEILQLYSQKTPGVLSIDGMPSIYASFSSFELKRSPIDGVIAYSFSFTQDTAKAPHDTPLYLYHTVESGQTLWHIALLYDMPIEMLVRKNPDIRDINELEEGSKICLT